MNYLYYYNKRIYAKYGENYALCDIFRNTEEFNLIRPTGMDIIQLAIEGKNLVYWGSDDYCALKGQFTPLRQNLVLLMAALNDEL